MQSFFVRLANREDVVELDDPLSRCWNLKTLGSEYALSMIRLEHVIDFYSNHR